jgi:hypothetical protein
LPLDVDDSLGGRRKIGPRGERPAANPHLCAKTLLRLYYTRDRILTAEARAGFVEPDLAPLPPVAG